MRPMLLVLAAALLLASLVLVSGHPNDPPMSNESDSDSSDSSDSSDTSNDESGEAESGGEESPYFPAAPEDRVPPDWVNGEPVCGICKTPFERSVGKFGEFFRCPRYQRLCRKAATLSLRVYREEREAHAAPTPELDAPDQAPERKCAEPDLKRKLPAVLDADSNAVDSPPPDIDKKPRICAPSDPHFRYLAVASRVLTDGASVRYFKCAGQGCPIRAKYHERTNSYEYYSTDNSQDICPTPFPPSAHPHPPSRTVRLRPEVVCDIRERAERNRHLSPFAIHSQMLADGHDNGVSAADRTRTPSLDQVRGILRYQRACEWQGDGFHERLQEAAAKSGLEYIFETSHRPRENRLLLHLYTPQTLDLLVRHGQDIAFLDGTFKLAERNLVLHVLAVVHKVSQQLLPAVFTFTDSATHQTYKQMLANIRELVPRWRPDVILTDMEQAYDLAIQSEFPDTAHRICWFHIQQALRKWMKKHGPSAESTQGEISGLMARLHNCESIEAFAETWKTVSPLLRKAGGPKLMDHLHARYIDKDGRRAPISPAMWCKFGASGSPADEYWTNRLEPFNRDLKLLLPTHGLAILTAIASLAVVLKRGMAMAERGDAGLDLTKAAKKKRNSSSALSLSSVHTTKKASSKSSPRKDTPKDTTVEYTEPHKVNTEQYPVRHPLHGYDVMETGGGGDCLFSSIAFQLGRLLRLRLSHLAVRAQIVASGVRLRGEPSMFVRPDGIGYCDLPEVKDPTYFTRMAKQGQWGSCNEVAFAAQAFGVTIDVFTSDQTSVSPVESFSAPNSRAHFALLWRREPYKADHWQALVPQGSVAVPSGAQEAPSALVLDSTSATAPSAPVVDSISAMTQVPSQATSPATAVLPRVKKAPSAPVLDSTCAEAPSAPVLDSTGATATTAVSPRVKKVYSAPSTQSPATAPRSLSAQLLAIEKEAADQAKQ